MKYSHSKSATIDPSAVIGDNSSISACIAIGPDVEIGESTYIAPYCKIERDVTIGSYCEVSSRLIGAGSTIEDRSQCRFETVPPGSLVCSTNEFGCGYNTSVMYLLDGSILVKPGCLPVEPIAATRARLEAIRDRQKASGSAGWSQILYPPALGHHKSTTRQAEAARMLAWFDWIESYYVYLG